MPPSRRSLLVCGLALLAAGCATRPSLVMSDETWPELEPVAVTAGHDGLTVRVASKGCAAKADFVFRVDRAGGKTALAFARRRLETCRFGEVGTVDLAFTYDELGLKRGERFVVANPSQ
jgi:hypothetical protein